MPYVVQSLQTLWFLFYYYSHLYKTAFENLRNLSKLSQLISEKLVGLNFNFRASDLLQILVP